MYEKKVIFTYFTNKKMNISRWMYDIYTCFFLSHSNDELICKNVITE